MNYNNGKTNAMARSSEARGMPLAAGRQEVKVINAFKDAQELTAPAVTELDLSQMTQSREQTHLQVAKVVEELERVRGESEELKRKLQRLDTLEQNQIKYEREQADLRDCLIRRMESLRKMDFDASRRAELYAAVRRRFEEMLQEVERLRAQTWEKSRYNEELNRALAILEDIQREYNRAWSRVEAVTVDKASPGTAELPAVRETPPAPFPIPRDFASWLRIGAALSLPLVAALLILVLVARWLWSPGL